jgi:hypothetical protein
MDGGMREVTKHSNMQQIRVAEKFLTYNEEPRDDSVKPKVTWIWGPPGCGKSRMARRITPKGDTYTKNTPTKWFDGYDAHEGLILDDFRDSWWPLTDMLSLIDRYERQVEVKGGQRQMRATHIVITCIWHPEQVYAKDNEPNAQLLRRLDSIVEIQSAAEMEEHYKQMHGEEEAGDEPDTQVLEQNSDFIYDPFAPQRIGSHAQPIELD